MHCTCLFSSKQWWNVFNERQILQILLPLLSLHTHEKSWNHSRHSISISVYNLVNTINRCNQTTTESRWTRKIDPRVNNWGVMFKVNSHYYYESILPLRRRFPSTKPKKKTQKLCSCVIKLEHFEYITILFIWLVCPTWKQNKFFSWWSLNRKYYREQKKKFINNFVVLTIKNNSGRMLMSVCYTRKWLIWFWCTSEMRAPSSSSSVQLKCCYLSFR